MAVDAGLGTPEFNVTRWCGRLAGTLDFLLDNLNEHALIAARETLDEYEADITRILAQAEPETRSNVVPFTRPPGFSINHAIDEQLGRKPLL